MKKLWEKQSIVMQKVQRIIKLRHIKKMVCHENVHNESEVQLFTNRQSMNSM